MLGSLTHSRVSCWMACRRKHRYRYILGIRPDVDAEALRIGTAVHDGLDWLAQGHSLVNVLVWISDAYSTVPSWCNSWAWERERETICRMLIGYEWYWKPLDTNEIIATEQAFGGENFEDRVPILHPDTGEEHPDWTLRGKIDKIIKNEHGRIGIREHKTTIGDIAVNGDYRNKLAMDRQFRLYAMAAIMCGHDVEFVEYDVLKKPTIRPRNVGKKDIEILKETGLYFGEKFLQYGPPGDQTLVSGLDIPKKENARLWGARLSSCIAEAPQSVYQRWLLPITEVDIKETQRDLWQIADDMADDCHKERDYKNPDSCCGVGKFKCEFFNLCANRVDPTKGLPQGFIQSDNIHPELGEGEKE